MLSDHQRITWGRNIAENFNHLSRVHERYRRHTDRQTDGRRQIANVNMSSRSLKTTPGQEVHKLGSLKNTRVKWQILLLVWVVQR